MPPSERNQITLEEEYGKKTGITPQDVAKLRQWLKTQPHLPEEQITDLDLILAYHCCNCSSEIAKQVLDLNLTLRTLFTGYFKDRKFDGSVKQNLTDILMTILPVRTNEGDAILYTHILETDPKKFFLGVSIKTVFMLIDVFQYEEGTWPGLHIVIDFEDVSLAHITRMDIQDIQKFLYYVQEAILVKLKGLHFLNAPSFIDKLLMLMKPFMKKELMTMLHIHTVGSKTIENFIPIEALPKESGGKHKTYHEIRDDMIRKLQDYSDFFEKENKKRVKESLRPGKPKTISDIFGSVEGSFKKLDID